MVYLHQKDTNDTGNKTVINSGRVFCNNARLFETIPTDQVYLFTISPKCCRFPANMRFIFVAIFTLLGFSAFADDGGSADADTDNFSLMKTFSDLGLYDINDETWNAYGQSTYISSWKPAFPAAYTNLNGTPNSLSPQAERSFTGTNTFYAGLKAPWQGGEIYYAPEMISETPLSTLHGLGSTIQNGELQKNGAVSATWYTSRFYLRQTVNLGGNSNRTDSGPMQLAGNFDSRRLVITTGNLSILDIFDKNPYTGDTRQQFTNMAFLTNSAYDFAADARGYTVGAAAEFYYEAWAFRFGHFASPKNPNDKPLDYRLFKYYGDQIELEHQHVIADRPGSIKLLAYRNRENMGSWTDAIAAYNANPSQNNAANCTGYNFGSANTGAPDLCWVRKANIKMGIGINLAQSLSDDVGVFLRGMYSDGKTEVDSYTSSDRSLSFGTQIKGGLWNRRKDAIGIGYEMSWLSAAHVAYLSMGGVDDFIGDGAIKYRSEQVADIYYKFNLISSAWITLDYQRITNPAYNADRGPVDVYAVRAHFEY